MESTNITEWSLLEVYDQIGMLIVVTHNGEVFENTRLLEQRSEYFSWYLDGQLKLSYEVGGKVLFNSMPANLFRIEHLSSLLEK